MGDESVLISSMKLIRAALKPLVLAYDRLTAPKPPKRGSEEQAKLDQATERLTLYQLVACPFCVKVRQLLRQGLTVKMKDIRADEAAHAELMAGGKLDQVPCLRIESETGTQWMYESTAINSYLEKEFPLGA
jgi:glutaredoxin